MRIVRSHASLYGLACLALTLVLQVHAQVQIVIPAGKDNTLFESATGASSNGAGAYLFVGNTNHGEARRALLAFDLSNIPSGAIIQSARLSLSMSKAISGPQNIALHRVLADWGEGTSDAAQEEGAGAAATPNDATWLHAFFNSVFWTNHGGDFSSTASATLSINAIGSYSWGSTAAMVSDVQGWLNTPTGNYGWVLIGNESANGSTKRFNSRQNPNSASRPILELIYNVTSAVDNESETSPAVFALDQNYPNPFNPVTTIRYELPRSAHVRLMIFSTTGTRIRTLVDGPEPAGARQVRWDGTDEDGMPAASGVYLCRIEAASFHTVRKLTLMK